MVEKLRRALEELEPPTCPNCHIEMKWTRSTLVGPDTVSHVFYCPSCHRTGETTSKIGPVVIPPDKLCAPAVRRVA